MRINVKAKKGLEFWCQGKKATSDSVIKVDKNHDVDCKIRDGALIVVSDKAKKKESE